MSEFSVYPFAISLVLGIAGWQLARWGRVPAPAMIGPMLLIAVTSVFDLPHMQIAGWFRLVIQSIVGGYVGRRINRAALISLRSMIPAIVTTTTWYVLGTALIGYAVARLALVDLGSAFLATAPGGVAEMTALAIASHVDVAFVATLQTFRVICSNVLVPLVVRWTPAPSMVSASTPDPILPPAEGVPWIVVVAIGLGGSVLFLLMNIPAAGVLGSMTAVAIVQLTGRAAQPVPRLVLNLTYIFLGISVGVSFSMATVLALQDSLGILLAATAATLASSFLLSFVVMRAMKLDVRTALLACSPGGLALMAVVAEEAGAQTVVVSMLHTVRIVWVMVSMPIFLRIASLF